MAVTALRCPSCGAEITLDDDREFGFCSYCGSKIQIGERMNVHVTHEYKGDTPDVNITNNYYYNDDQDDNNSNVNITVKKPSSKRLVWGIILAVIGFVGLFGADNASEKTASYFVIVIVFIVLGIILVISNIISFKNYNLLLKEAIKNKHTINRK